MRSRACGVDPIEPAVGSEPVGNVSELSRGISGVVMTQVFGGDVAAYFVEMVRAIYQTAKHWRDFLRLLTI